jgi:hypothetical protein
MRSLTHLPVLFVGTCFMMSGYTRSPAHPANDVRILRPTDAQRMTANLHEGRPWGDCDLNVRRDKTESVPAWPPYL